MTSAITMDIITDKGTATFTGKKKETAALQLTIHRNQELTLREMQ
ncbi:hypothetical protein [Polluticoccus soli]